MKNPPATSRKERLWTPEYLLASLSIHFFFLAYALLLTVIPVYVVDEMGWSEWQLGIVVGAFGLSSLMLRPFAGQWIAKWGGKVILIVGTLLFAIGFLSYMGAFSLLVLLGVRFFHGMGQAMAPVACNTIVANIVPESRRAEGFGYYGNSPTLATAYGPGLGFWLITTHGSDIAFAVGAVISVLGALSALPISNAKTRSRRQAAESVKVPLINKAAVFPSLVFLASTTSLGALAAFLPLLTEEKGLGNPGIFYVVNAAVSIVARVAAGPLADKTSRDAVIIPGLAMTAVSMFILGLATNQVMYLGSSALLGIGFAFVHTGLMALTVDRVSPVERSSALATFQLSWDIGGSGGAVLPGFIARAVGLSFAFGVVGFFSVASLIGFAAAGVLARRPQPDKASTSTAGPDD